MPEKIEVTKITLSYFAKASKSGNRYYFVIEPADIRNRRIIHGKWYELFLRELSEEEIKELNLK